MKPFLKTLIDLILKRVFIPLCLPAIIPLATTAQLPYDAPNVVKGTVECILKQQYSEKQNDVIISKTVTEIRFSTEVLVSIGYTSADLDEIHRQAKNLSRLPHIAAGNNFIRTRDSAESWDAAIPRAKTGITFSEDKWITDPCQHGSGELEKNSHSEGSGFMRDPARGVTLGIEGLKNDPGCFVVRLFVDGGWGNIPDMTVSSKVYGPDSDDPSYPCRWHDAGYSFTLPTPSLNSILLTGTDLPERYQGSAGVYRSVEDHSYEGLITTYRNEFFVIDSATMFDYLRKRPAVQEFSMAGYYQKETKEAETGNSNMFTESSKLTLTLGSRKEELLLYAAPATDYHQWMPGRAGEEGYVLFTAIAEIQSDDDNAADVIYFTLDEVSHYPGYCTNYPLPSGPEPSDAGTDIRFSENQPDPNITFIDPFTVQTNRRVKLAEVAVESDDYGGKARLKAWTESKHLEGKSLYNDLISLKIPEDDDDNLLADAWEKKTGIYGKKFNLTDDTDEYPAGQSDEGDGYSVFEEYRGFFAEKDFCRNPDKNFRQGKHVRTDPNWKDVFIFDATGEVFENYYTPENPADLNWHLAAEGQVKTVSAGEVLSMLNQAPKLPEGDIANKEPICKILKDRDHRRINCNTPAELMAGPHYAIFLMYSPRLNGSMTAGEVSIDNKITGSVKATQFIEIQQYEPYRERVVKNCPHRAVCTQISCSFNSLRDDNTSCKLCGSPLSFEPYYNRDQMLQIAAVTYKGSVIHEIGHNLTSADHHQNGLARYADTAHKEYAISGQNLMNFNFSKADQVAALNKLAEVGVKECAMLYNFQRNEEWTSGSLMNNRPYRFCRKGEIYLDDYGNRQPADNCYGKISAK